MVWSVDWKQPQALNTKVQHVCSSFFSLLFWKTKTNNHRRNYCFATKIFLGLCLIRFLFFFFVFSLIHTTISFVLRDCCYVRTLCFNNFLSGMFFPVPLLVHHFSNLFNKAFNFNEMERSLLYNGLDSVRNCVWIYDFPVYLQSNQTLRCKSPVWCSLMFTYGLNKHFSFATIWKINSRTD